MPSSNLSKIGACCLGAVERPSLTALKRVTIAVMAASIWPDAVAMRPRSPSRSTVTVAAVAPSNFAREGGDWGRKQAEGGGG